MSENNNTGFLGFEILKDVSYDLWKPEINEERAIKLERTQDQPGKKDGVFKVGYGVDLITGESIAWVLGAVMENEFKGNEIVPGDCIGLRYLGKLKTKSGDMANNWQLYILKEVSKEDIIKVQATAQALKAAKAGKVEPKKSTGKTKTK